MFSGHLWKSSFSLLIAAVALLGLCTANARVAKIPTDSFSFSESQKDSLTCSNKTSGTCDMITTGKFTVKALFFAGDEATVGSITKTDEVDVIIGNWEFDDIVENGKLGKGTALFELPNKSGTVELKISAKGFEVDVKARTGATEDEEFQPSVIADDHATDDAAFTDTIDVSISINSDTFVDSFTVGVRGIAATKTAIKKGGTFDLNSVKVKSTGIMAPQ